MRNISIRPAIKNDFDFVADNMESALEKYYDGDHFAHALRIFNAHIDGGNDKVGFFSISQKMFIAEYEGVKCGILHLVLKRQETCKISPLIVVKSYRKSKGVGKALLNFAEQYAKENNCRQLYCTVSKDNHEALNFFKANNFVSPGLSDSHYKVGKKEIMLYKHLEESLSIKEFEKKNISVLPLEEKYKEQVRSLLLNTISEDFKGIDDSWVDALFEGHKRSASGDVNQKYKLIFTATDREGKVLGIAGATPKKGQPIKLMPFVATTSPAFFALLSDVPFSLKEFGRKVYVHIVPSAEETRFLQTSGWRLDALLPDSYKREVVTQQWSKHIDTRKVIRPMRIKDDYLNYIIEGSKTLEVRVGYSGIKKIKKGQELEFSSHLGKVNKKVKDIRYYVSFAEMLSNEDYRKIVPGLTEDEVEKLLKRIYPKQKERKGVIVLEVYWLF